MGGQLLLQTVAGLTAGSDTVEVLPCKCLGKCKQGPAMRFRTEGASPTTYTKVVAEQVPGLLNAHFRQAPEAQQAAQASLS